MEEKTFRNENSKVSSVSKRLRAIVEIAGKALRNLRSFTNGNNPKSQKTQQRVIRHVRRAGSEAAEQEDFRNEVRNGNARIRRLYAKGVPTTRAKDISMLYAHKAPPLPESHVYSTQGHRNRTPLASIAEGNEETVAFKEEPEIAPDEKAEIPAMEEKGPKEKGGESTSLTSDQKPKMSAKERGGDVRNDNIEHRKKGADEKAELPTRKEKGPKEKGGESISSASVPKPKMTANERRDHFINDTKERRRPKVKGRGGKKEGKKTKRKKGQKDGTSHDAKSLQNLTIVIPPAAAKGAPIPPPIRRVRQPSTGKKPGRRLG